MGFYVYMTSEDSVSMFPDCTYYDFVVQLPSYINLSESCSFGWQQSWHIGISDISLIVEGQRFISSLPTDCVILCNLLTESYLRGRFAPVLRILPAGSELSATVGSIYYKQVHSNAQSFNEIRIQVRDSALKPLDLAKWPKKGKLCLTLHFLRE